MVQKFIQRRRHAGLLPKADHGSGEHFHLGFPPVLDILKGGGFIGIGNLFELLQLPDRVVVIDVDAFFAGDINDLFGHHEAEGVGVFAGIPRAEGDVEHCANLIFADIAYEFHPEGFLHIRLNHRPDSGALQQVFYC